LHHTVLKLLGSSEVLLKDWPFYVHGQPCSNVEVIQTICQLLQRIFNALWQIGRGYWQPSDKYVLFAKVAILSDE
jgi:hypothetical protein